MVLRLQWLGIKQWDTQVIIIVDLMLYVHVYVFVFIYISTVSLSKGYSKLYNALL